MSPRAAPLRRAAVTAALLAASALLAIGAAEIALRLLHPQTLLHDPDAFDPDPLLGGRLKPGFRDVFTTSEYSTRWEINASGYRGPGAGARKRGVFRIAVAGDSFTFGYGVEESETYPRVLESLLGAERPSGCEVFNLGAGGYGTVQEVAWLSENLARGLDPDLAVIGFYPGNDLSDSVRGSAAAAAAGGARSAAGGAPSGSPPGVPRAERMKRWLGSRSHLYALVADRADGLLIRLGLRNVVYPEEVEVLRVDSPPQVGAGWREVHAALDELGSLAKRHGFRALVMLIPMRHQVVPASWERVKDYYRLISGGILEGVDLDLPGRRLGAICAEAGLPLLDLTARFRAAPDPARLYFRRDQHWTRDGHALAAGLLARRLGELP